MQAYSKHSFLRFALLEA